MLERNICIKLSIFINVFISTAIYFSDMYMYYLYFVLPSIIIYMNQNDVHKVIILYEPVPKKTNNLGSDKVQHKPGCTVTEDMLEAGNFGFRKKRICAILVAKTKALISFAITAKLICAFAFAYADCWFSHAAAHIYILGGETTRGAKRLGGRNDWGGGGAKRLVGAKRLGGKRLGGKRLGGETTRGRNVPDSITCRLTLPHPLVAVVRIVFNL